MQCRYRTTARPDHSFARRHRLCTAAEFDRVFREGQRSADRLFTVLYSPNTQPEPRLGFAISRRRVRSAVARNRVRRQVRESFRLNRARLPNCDLVFMAREAATAASNEELRESLARHWQRIQRNTTGPGRTDG